MARPTRDALQFAAVSAGVLAVVEMALLRTDGRPYTDLYRSTRAHPSRVVAAAPLAAAVVTVLHLEGVLPSRVDPYYWLGRVLARGGAGR